MADRMEGTRCVFSRLKAHLTDKHGDRGEECVMEADLRASSCARPTSVRSPHCDKAQRRLDTVDEAQERLSTVDKAERRLDTCTLVEACLSKRRCKAASPKTFHSPAKALTPSPLTPPRELQNSKASPKKLVRTGSCGSLLALDNVEPLTPLAPYREFSSCHGGAPHPLLLAMMTKTQPPHTKISTPSFLDRLDQSLLREEEPSGHPARCSLEQPTTPRRSLDKAYRRASLDKAPAPVARTFTPSDLSGSKIVHVMAA
eukprot:3553068-Pyramimonas_sp.AAC.2